MARDVVVDIDRGYNKLLRDFSAFGKSSVTIGFQKGTETKAQTKNGRVKKSGQSIAEIAAKNEFGTDKIPARPFMRTGFDENINLISRYISQLTGEVADGKISPENALGRIGQAVKGLIVKKIMSIYVPPNSPRTIAIKKSSKPLVDFGQMRASVQWKVNL